MKISTVNALTLLFIGLKLSHNIDWSWWLVLSPTIIWSTLFSIAVIVEIVRQTKLKLKLKRENITWKKKYGIS